jgi:hypothetical protein
MVLSLSIYPTNVREPQSIASAENLKAIAPPPSTRTLTTYLVGLRKTVVDSIRIPEFPDSGRKTTASCVVSAEPEIVQLPVVFPFWVTCPVVHAMT